MKMAEESEKRFHAVMDKLFQTPPKSKLAATSSSGQLSRGQKRANASYELSVVNPKPAFRAAERLGNLSGSSGTTQAPLCRPWDRGDFFRRLATFKSMSWFAKPQVVSAVNCARRGWINIDMDTIACEACGVRLFFSCPPSWGQQQVDKAALVFSLKLDSGHKLLCPWVDSACDENLAAFPPTLTTVLVDEYKSRCSALMQLVALPVISSSVVNYLRSTQLEEFLKTSSTVESDRSTETSRAGDLGNEPKSTSSLTYYQAQKLISLCGWEPRALPYIVDSRDQLNQSDKDNKHGYISQFREWNHRITILSSSNENSGANDDTQTSNGTVSDPNSVVLECQICGARVGLWAFPMVQRPLEFLRLSGYTDINSENVADDHMVGAPGNLLLSGDNNDKSKEGGANTAFAVSTALNERPSNLNITIAGGPLPEKQNYRAKISLPVVGQNLRAQFSIDSDIRDGSTAESSLVGEGQNISLDEKNNAEQGISDTIKSDPIAEVQSQDNQMVAQVSSEIDKLPDHADNVERNDPVVADHSIYQTGDDLGSAREGGSTSHQGKISDYNGLDGGKYNSKQAVKQGDRKDTGVELIVQNHDIVPAVAKTSQEVPLDRAMEFDPIRLHKHYCPWIARSGGSEPGWQQTLSALQHHQEFSYPLTGDVPSSSLIKVDDPVASVKRLFTPPTKRKKLMRS